MSISKSCNEFRKSYWGTLKVGVVDTFVVYNCEISRNGMVCCELRFCGGVVSRETGEWTRYMNVWKPHGVYQSFNRGLPRFTSCD